MELVFLFLLDQMLYAQYVGYLARLFEVAAEIDNQGVQMIKARCVALVDHIQAQCACFIAQTSGYLSYAAAVEYLYSNGFGEGSGRRLWRVWSWRWGWPGKMGPEGRAQKNGYCRCGQDP